MRLVMNLGEWRVWQIASALVLSLASVSAFVVLVGLVLLPADMQRIREPLYASITYCHVLPRSERAVSLVWYMPFDTRDGWRHQLTGHSLSGERPALQMAWPELRPVSVAAGALPHELYVACFDGKLWRVDLTRPEVAPQELGAHTEPGPHLIAGSRDGRWLASLGPKSLQILDLKSGEQAWVSEGGRVRCFALHPDSRRMLVSRDDGQLDEVALATGQTLRTIPGQDGEIINAHFSPDGRLAVMVSAFGALSLLDWEAGRSAWPSDWKDCPHTFRSGVAQFSPSGDRLITSGADTTVLVVWNLRTMRLEGELRGHTRSINGATFLDDERLCSFGADGTVRIWNLARGGPPRVLTIDVTEQAG